MAENIRNDTHLVVISGNIKSWAFGLEAINSIKKNFSNARVEILDLSKISHILPRARKRKSFLRKFAKQNKIVIYRIGNLDVLRYLIRTSYLTLTNRPIEFVTNYENLIASSIAHRYHSSDLQKDIVSFFRMLIWNVQILLTKDIVLKHLDSDYINLYLFNGRKIVEATVISTLLQEKDSSKLKISIYERASSENLYDIFSKSPHNNREWQEKIELFIKQNDEAFQTVNQSKLYEEYLELKRTQGTFLTQHDWKSRFRNTKNNFPSGGYVAFFSTSTYEVTPIETFRDLDPFRSQFEAINELANVCAEFNLTLIIRRHPSSKKQSGSKDFEKGLWEDLRKKSNVIFIDVDDLSDSYEIAEKAIISFCWKSSIGIELLAMGLPCYTFGTAKYDWNNSILISSSEEMRSLLEKTLKGSQTSVTVVSKSLVKRYLFFALNHGRRLELFKSVHRWGVILHSGKRIYNREFERVFNYFGFVSKD